MSGPHPPPLTPSALEPLITSLNALQSQFAAVQEDLGVVKSDVSDVLIQLDSLRRTQNMSYMSVAQLEDVIGVPIDSKSEARARRRRVGGALASGPDPQTTPEKTFFQSLASIQSAIDKLLAASKSRASFSPEASPSPMPGQEACQTSFSSTFITDPSQHSTESRSTQPAPTNVHFRKHASIQACPSLPGPGPSYPLPQTCASVYVPWWFNPGHWNYSPCLPATNSMRPTTHTPECLAQSLRDTHHPGTQTLVTHENAPRGSTTQYNQLPSPTISILPVASSSSAVPPACGGSPATEESSLFSKTGSVHSVLSQLGPLAVEGTSSSVTPASTVALVDLRTSSSPLSALSTSTSDIPMSFFDTSQFEEPSNRAVQPQKTLVATENGELTPCPSTPQSNISADDQMSQTVGRLDGDATFPRIILRDIPSSPYRTLEPLVEDEIPGQGSGIQGSQDSPLTPRSSSPPSAVGLLLKKGASDASRQAVAERVVEQHQEFTADARSTVVYGGDGVEGYNAGHSVNNASSRPERSEELVERSTVGMSSGILASPVTVDGNDGKDNDARLSLQTDLAGFTSVTGSGTSVATIRGGPQSTAASKGDSSQVAVVDIVLPITPTSLAGNESPKDEHGLGSTSLSQLPLFLPSSTTSRYATPSGSPDLRFTQDEEEVWSALVDTSGMSTPMPDDMPLMPSRPPARFPSVPHIPQQNHTSKSTHAGSAGVEHTPSTSVPELLAVAPSMLHDSDGSASPPAANGSLSPLTSLDDSDIDEPAATQSNKEPSATAPIGEAAESREGSYQRRCSEPYRAGSRLLGGPNASLNELAVLARRNPLKIHIVVPESLRSLKRKRDGVDGGAMEIERESFVDEDILQGRRAESACGSVLPDGMGERESAPVMPTRRTLERSPSSNLVDTANELPEVSHIPRKRTKKRREHTKVHETLLTSEDQQKSNRNSQEVFHFRRGQIVTIDYGLEHKSEDQHQPQAPVIPPDSQSPTRNDEFGQDSRTPTQICHNNEAMKTPSSSVNLPLLAPPSASIIESSLLKEDECSAMWPELPSLFSQWHMQFIQCDMCDKWFHYGCVAIESGDRRLEPEVSFVCPPCCAESSGCQTPLDRENTCARPGCPEPHTTGDSGHFFVEKLVGLKWVEGYFYMWLAKWEGYPMTEATWIPKENMDGDGSKLCNAFLEDAKREGADLSRDVVLLKEAIEAGWEL